MKPRAITLCLILMSSFEPALAKCASLFAPRPWAEPASSETGQRIRELIRTEDWKEDKDAVVGAVIDHLGLSPSDPIFTLDGGKILLVHRGRDEEVEYRRGG